MPGGCNYGERFTNIVLRVASNVPERNETFPERGKEFGERCNNEVERLAPG